MRCFFTAALAVFLNAAQVWAGQPAGIRLDPNGMSLIYPVLDTAGWILTQPSASKLYNSSDRTRLTHWADEFYAQDWARGCGLTHGQKLFAGISGEIVLAGQRGPYGNTVVILDRESGFALKYSHLSELAVSVGEYVLAGQSFIGRVGNTGNSQSQSGCSQSPGAHLHLALFKNVTNVARRPITTTTASSGVGPTAYAAAFGFAAQQELVKAEGSPAVYVHYYGTKVLVTAASFESNGWNFDKNQSVFNVLLGRTFDAAYVNSIPTAGYIWPMRETSLSKTSAQETVSVFDDGRKLALTYDEFMCRGLRFNEVRAVPDAEDRLYLPQSTMLARGCAPALKQSLADFQRFASFQPGLSAPDLSSYGFYPDWDPYWELRWLLFQHSSGTPAVLYRTNAVNDHTQKYVGYTDPQTGIWSGWQRVD
jgi:hypothetical protein